jgi:Flp pilus assembly protein TadG
MRFYMRVRQVFRDFFKSISHRSLRRSVRGVLNGTSGATAVEFSFIAPVLVLMTVCTIDMGIGFYRYLQVEGAAGAGARYAALHGFNATTLATAISSATSYSGISASPAPTQFCGCPSTSGIAVVTCGSTCTGGITAGTYVTTSAQATYSPIIQYPMLPNQFTLSAKSTMRIQ